MLSLLISQTKKHELISIGIRLMLYVDAFLKAHFCYKFMLVECFGGLLAVGSRYCMALLMAVVASPNPVAVSFTFPGYALILPAALMPGIVVSIFEFTTILLRSMSSPQSTIGPNLEIKP